MSGDAIDYIRVNLEMVYPNQPIEWLQRAAVEMFRFNDSYSNPTMEQRIELDRRIQNMCTTGQW